MASKDFFALRTPLPRTTAAALGFVMPALVLGAWCVITYGGFAPPDFLPSPTEVVKGTLQLFIQYDLWDAILTSTWRIVQAFLLASALALPLGILMGAKLKIAEYVVRNRPHAATRLAQDCASESGGEALQLLGRTRCWEAYSQDVAVSCVHSASMRSQTARRAGPVQQI